MTVVATIAYSFERKNIGVVESCLCFCPIAGTGLNSMISSAIDLEESLRDTREKEFIKSLTGEKKLNKAVESFLKCDNKISVDKSLLRINTFNHSIAMIFFAIFHIL